jgi:hypothetical protein
MQHRPPEYGLMPDLEYNGFTIDKYFNICRNGKRVKFPQCWSLESAKSIIDQSNAAKIIKPGVDLGRSLFKLTHEEQQERERQDESDKIDQYFEMQLNPDI